MHGSIQQVLHCTAGVPQPIDHSIIDGLPNIETVGCFRTSLGAFEDILGFSRVSFQEEIVLSVLCLPQFDMPSEICHMVDSKSKVEDRVYLRMISVWSTLRQLGEVGLARVKPSNIKDFKLIFLTKIEYSPVRTLDWLGYCRLLLLLACATVSDNSEGVARP